MKTKKFYFPIIVIFKDRVIDCGGAERIIIPGIYLAKGRTLTLTNPADRMEVVLGRLIRKIEGDLRVKKKPIEISPEQLREMVESEALQNNQSEKNEQENIEGAERVDREA